MTHMDLEPVARLTKDLREAARTLSDAEARYMVDGYYMMQQQRIRADNQIRALTKTKEPHDLLIWFSGQATTLENQVKRALSVYADSSPVGRWSQAQMGIGPVLAAGLLAHIDMEHCPTVGHVWRFAGLDPTVRWGEGERRPWNASLKVICWKIGESFKKVSGREDAMYGQLYATRKALEESRNAAGLFAAQAEAKLQEQPRHKQRAIYKTGQLPPGRLDLRAMRYAVKLFLSHWHEAAYVAKHGTLPPKPYILTQPEHVHYRQAQHMEEIPGWTELRSRLP